MAGRIAAAGPSWRENMELDLDQTEWRCVAPKIGATGRTGRLGRRRKDALNSRHAEGTTLKGGDANAAYRARRHCGR